MAAAAAAAAKLRRAQAWAVLVRCWCGRLVRRSGRRRKAKSHAQAHHMATLHLRVCHELRNVDRKDGAKIGQGVPALLVECSRVLAQLVLLEQLTNGRGHVVDGGSGWTAVGNAVEDAVVKIRCNGK